MGQRVKREGLADSGKRIGLVAPLGGLAGMLSAATIVALVQLLFVGWGIFITILHYSGALQAQAEFFFRAEQIGPPTGLQSLINAGKNFLAAWPGYLALGALGAITALLHEAVHRRWGRRLAQWASACALFLASEGVIIGWMVQQRTQHASYLASRSRVSQRLYAPFYLLSNLDIGFIGTAIAFFVTLALWQLWEWWYERLSPMGVIPQEMPSPTLGEMPTSQRQAERSYAQHLAQLKREVHEQRPGEGNQDELSDRKAA